MGVRRSTGVAVLGVLLVGSPLPPALPQTSRAQELLPTPAAPQQEPMPVSPEPSPSGLQPAAPEPERPDRAPPPLPPLPGAPLPPDPAKPNPRSPSAPPRSAPAATPPGGASPAAAGPVTLLLIDLSGQRLTAFDGEGRRLYRALVSTGLASMPTPAGQFRVAGKYPSTPIVGEGYRIPAVAHVMCLGGGGLRPDRICIHPAPWQEAARQAFGVRRSHGCIRVSSATARWLFQHTPAGTPVRIEP